MARKARAQASATRQRDVGSGHGGTVAPRRRGIAEAAGNVGRATRRHRGGKRKFGRGCRQRAETHHRAARAGRGVVMGGWAIAAVRRRGDIRCHGGHRTVMVIAARGGGVAGAIARSGVTETRVFMPGHMRCFGMIRGGRDNLLDARRGPRRIGGERQRQARQQHTGEVKQRKAPAGAQPRGPGQARTRPIARSSQAHAHGRSIPHPGMSASPRIAAPSPSTKRPGTRPGQFLGWEETIERDAMIPW